MIIKTMIEQIGPERAKQLLDNNYENNRNIRKIWVSTLADMMTRGEFRSLNGQNSIILGTDGKLYDGQHRLLAIIKSGVTLPFVINITDTPQDDYLTYDYTSIRRPYDMVNIPNASKVCAITRFLVCVEYGNVPIGSILIGRKELYVPPSRTEITNFINNNEERVIDITRKANRIYESLNVGGVAIYGLFIGLVEYVHDDMMLDEFVDEISNAGTTNITILAMRETIRRAYIKNKKPTKAFILGTMLCAYHHFKLGDNSTTLNKSAQYINKYSKLMDEERETRKEMNDANHKKNDAQ